MTIAGSVGDGYGGQSAGYQFTTTNIAHDHRIGVYEVTNDQWDKFQDELGVPVTGTPSSAYDQSSYYTGTKVPTNMVSWYEAAQFVNWLNIEAGHQPAYKFTGTQGTGSYTFDTWSAAEADNGTNLYRHKDAFYYLPTENEWVKAGYWNGTDLQTYATTPGDTLHQGDGTSGTGWNYYDSSEYAHPGPWDVGSGSEELNGTFDMMGNIHERMESPWSDPNFGPGSVRGLRGGSFDSGYVNLVASSDRLYYNYPSNEYNYFGFRVASEVPVAVPVPLALPAGLIGLGLVMRRRRAPFSL